MFVGFDPVDYIVSEGDSEDLMIVRVGDAEGPVVVRVNTRDGTAIGVFIYSTQFRLILFPFFPISWD